MQDNAGGESLARDASSAGHTIRLDPFIYAVQWLPLLLLPKKENNLQEESKVFFWTPHLQHQLEERTQPAGRTKLPDGDSATTAPSAAAQHNKAGTPCCFCMTKYDMESERFW